MTSGDCTDTLSNFLSFLKNSPCLCCLQSLFKFLIFRFSHFFLSIFAAYIYRSLPFSIFSTSFIFIVRTHPINVGNALLVNEIPSLLRNPIILCHSWCYKMFSCCICNCFAKFRQSVFDSVTRFLQEFDGYTIALYST